MWTKGFHPVGLNEILAAVGVPKGSFYHYFKSKEHFGVEMLKHYIQAATADKRHAVDACDGDPDPINRLLDMLAESIVIFEEKGGRCPCLVLKLASEVSDSSEPMREVLAKGMQTWLGVLTAPFDEALMKGIIPENTDPGTEAEIVRDLWAGAIQRATIMKSKEPMETALAFLRTHFAALRLLPSVGKLQSA